MTMLLRKSVFIHVPRTGGMWVRALARQLGLVVMESRDDFWNHATHDDLPDCLRSLPSFGFVRHPLRWVRSRWAHSLAIGANRERRFHGIHAIFDKLVRPTLEETLWEILTHRPGLVGETFAKALQDVTLIRRTMDLPYAGFWVLGALEGITEDLTMRSQKPPPPCNVTPGTEQVDGELARRFLESESLALEMWRAAGVEDARPVC